MKMIIDIPEVDYECAKQRWMMGNDAHKMDYYISIGIPLKDVKAEIEQICQEIDTVLHNEYENAVEQGKEIAYENVLSILDNICKAESEDKE